MRDLTAKWIVPSQLQYETFYLTISILRLLRKHNKKDGSKYGNKNTSRIINNILSNNLVGSFSLLTLFHLLIVSLLLIFCPVNLLNLLLVGLQTKDVSSLEEGVDTAEDLPEIKVIKMLIV